VEHRSAHGVEFAVSASLRKTLRKVHRSIATDRRWQIRFDFAFEQVMRECAAPRRDGAGTWISEDIVTGYRALHRLGYAHSAEVWLDGKLVGGAYGVSIGHMFYGESMFTRVSNGSKIALAYLVHFLRQNGVAMIDCQQQTDHLASLGAQPIARSEFLQHLKQAIEQPQIHNWRPLPLFTD
jgi:leucyl/phenylalanyl-tRNA--protein transferase